MFEGTLKQSTAATVTVLMISSADHIAGKTGLSAGLTIYATKAGATPAAITPTVTELDSTNMPGLYSLALTTAHTNTLGELAIRVSGSGADPTDIKWQVSARLNDDLAFPATSGRSMVVDAAGLVDANAVKVGPSGAGTAQTAGDIIGDTNDIQTRLPAALVSGRIDASVGAMAANVMTAAAAASDLTTELQAGLATASALTAVAGDITSVKAKTDNLPSSPADETLIIAATNSLAALIGTPVSSVAADIAAVKAVDDAIKAKTDNLPASPAALSDIPTVADILTGAVDGTVTLEQSMRLWNSALGGKASGLGTSTATFRDLADTKDRITATVDADGNRTAVTRDLT